MRSFFRVVRSALRYRFTLAAAMLCSLAIGVLWGANIGTLYPLVEIMFRGESIQESLEHKIADAEGNSRALAVDIAELEELLVDSSGDKKSNLQSKIAGKQVRLDAEKKAIKVSRKYQPYVEQYCPQDPFRALVLVIGLLLLGTILKSFFLMANVALIARVVQLTMVDIQNEFFRRTLHQDMATFQQQATGGLVGRFVNEMRMMSGSLEAFFGSAIREPLKMAACLIGTAMISWRLLLLSMVCAPIGLILLRLLSKTVKRTTQHSLDLMSEQIRRLTESYGGFVTVKAFNLERQERSRFRHVTKEISWMSRKISFFFSMSKPISEIMAMGVTSIAILAGAYLVLNRETHLFGLRITDRPMNPASLLVFFGLLAGIADPARKMSGIFGQIYMGVVSSQSIYRMMDQPASIKQVPSALPFKGLEHDLTIEGVQFGYHPEEPILHDVDLHIRAGERIALVGHNGCGKSTLIKLLMRFYDPNAGRVCLDGQDLRDYRIRDVRRQLGLVTQETWMFDDTIAGNIRCGKPNATDEEVIEAARKAHAHEFVSQDLPQGYETMVGEGGCRLSGGQRQRIALARVILRDPSILILDEATSEIDLLSEQLIHESLAEFTQGRTTIMITHQLSTLELADRVVVFERGRILDAGSNEELQGRCEVYDRLLASQAQVAAA